MRFNIFRLSLILCAVTAWLPGMALAAPATVSASHDSLEQRIKACTACHAQQERHDAFFPRIAGKPAGYLYNQLLNFREGRRHYPMMNYMVEHLPDDYLREIAAYFAAQHPAPPPAQSSNAGTAALARGKQLVLQGDRAKKIPACIACHGEKLAGAAPAIPGLLGLPRDYINAQFGAWKNGIRRAQAPDCMAHIAQRLSDADVGAVSAWLGTQVASADARPADNIALPLPLHCGGVPGSTAQVAP
ncbi:c-type cytochrome [Janthinobacterium sp. HLX7-2]|uniref:c-type cytochrome n=1 Tax=Janthinobacterium sp. HLX7-2 TaxID=1259331 RepID=UPI003F2265B9